jgi:hypothetical protein
LFAAFIVSAAALAVVLAACGGGDKKEGGATATSAATHTPAGGGGKTAAATQTTAAGGGTEDVSATIKKLTEEYKTFTGKVKYEIKDLSGVDSSGLSAMTFYQKGDKSRVDIESADGNIIVINTPDANYMCTKGQCLKSAGTSGADSSIAPLMSLIDPGTIESEFGSLPKGIDVKSSKEKIAGVEATCLSAKGDLDPQTPGEEAGEICIAEGGLLLRLTFTSGGTSGSFEASEASTKVSDSDFEPPYNVVDISQLGQ